MCSLVKRISVALAVVFLFAYTVNAYTVVLRSGRVVEIPSEFTVTAKTLTYEVAPGIQVTLQLTAIDIAATEKANKEAPGSFQKRIEGAAAPSTPEAVPGEPLKATRSVTNRDLEEIMKLRRESEVAFEKRLKELGLPSLDETRRQAAQSQSLDDLIIQKRSEDREAEAFWRARASSLRTERLAVEAEIEYLRARINEVPAFPATGSFTVVSSVLPFGPIGRSAVSPSFRSHRSAGHFGTRPIGPSVFSARAGAVGPARGNVGPVRGGVFNGQRGFSRGRFQRGLGTIGFPGVLAFPNNTVFSSPLQPHDFSYERTVLITRLNELLAVKAGLDARWRVLEDEARRGGAQPGWLRP